MTQNRHRRSASARTAASSARTHTASASCSARITAPRATTERAPAARQPGHRARPVGIDVRARSCASRRPPSRRRSRGSSRTIGSASWSTTMSSMSSSSRRPRRARRAEAPSSACARSRRAAARTSREGWLRGCEQVASHLAERGVNRCLLLTDGLANVGITDHEQLAIHAAELRARGVSTSTFGVGNDFDERPAPGTRGCRRRPLLLHRGRAADPRRDHVRSRRDARDRGPRRPPRDHRARRHPDRADQPVQGGGRWQPDARVARRARLGAGRRGRPAPVVPVRAPRPRDRSDRRADRSGRCLRARRDRADGPGAPDLDLCGRRGQRHPAARPRAWTGRWPACSRPGRDRKPSGAIASATTRGAGRSWTPPRERIRGYAGNDPEMRALIDALTQDETSSRPRWPRLVASRRTSPVRTVLRCRDASGRSLKRG